MVCDVSGQLRSGAGAAGADRARGGGGELDTGRPRKASTLGVREAPPAPRPSREACDADRLTAGDEDRRLRCLECSQEKDVIVCS